MANTSNALPPCGALIKMDGFVNAYRVRYSDDERVVVHAVYGDNCETRAGITFGHASWLPSMPTWKIIDG